MAHTKAGGSTKLGRDSRSKRLGIKRNEGQKVLVGEILVRQRGSKYLAGQNVKKAKDDTLFAVKEGIVRFSQKRKRGFDGNMRCATLIRVESKS